MGTITVPNVGTFDVPDTFGNLPPDQQHALVQQMVAHVSNPGTPAPDGSLLGAAENSITHGVPAALASGLSGATRWIERITGRNDPTALSHANSEDAYAAQQAQEQAQNYQRPGDVAPSIAAGWAEGQGLGDKLEKAGKAGLYGLAENAGPVGVGVIGAPLAAAAATAGAPAAAAVGSAGLATSGLMSLAGVRAAKARAGLDPNDVSTGDILNAAGQTALNAIPGGGTASGLLLRAGLRATSAGLKGAAAPIANDLGALAQGGSFGGGVPGNAATVASDALDGYATGFGLGAAHGITAGVTDATGRTIQAVMDPARLGPQDKAFLDESRQWNAAVQQKAQAIKAASPDMDPATLQDQASAAAVQDGAVPPNLSPDAQNGAARLALLNMFQARSQAEGQRGANSDGKAAANTFKGIADDLKGVLTGMGNQLNGLGLLDNDTHAALRLAIQQAAQHNRNLAENGPENGYLPTAMDTIQAAPLDPQIKAVITGTLRMLDQASSNGMLNNSKGPLERNAALLGPLAGLGAGITTTALSGIPGAEGAGLLAGQFIKAQAAQYLRGLDQVMGWNQPPALQGADAFQRQAAAQSIQPNLTPGNIQDTLGQIAALRSITPGRPPQGSPQSPPGMAQGAPVSRPVRYVPQAPQAPQEAQAVPTTTTTTAAAAAAISTPPNLAQAMAATSGVIPPGVMDPIPPSPPLPQPGPPAGASGSPQARPQGMQPGTPQGSPQAPSPVGLPPDVARLQQALGAAQAQRQAAMDQQAATFKAGMSGPMVPGFLATVADHFQVPASAIVDGLRAREAAGAFPQGYVDDLLAAPRISEDHLMALYSDTRNMRDTGQIPTIASLASRQDPGGVASRGGGMSTTAAMRLASYRASIAQEAQAATAIRQTAPDLSPLVSAIQAQSTIRGRGQTLRSYLDTIPDQADRARVSAIVTPLTLFGSKARPSNNE